MDDCGGRIQCKIGSHDALEKFIAWDLYLQVKYRILNVEAVNGVVTLEDIRIPKLDIDAEEIIILVYFLAYEFNNKKVILGNLISIQIIGIIFYH